MLLREIEYRKKIVSQLSHCFTDYRAPWLVEHSMEELLMQRICGLALGYEDLNDHDSLRHDPLLAGKSTLNRLELSAGGVSGKDKKITADTEAIAGLLIELGVKASIGKFASSFSKLQRESPSVVAESTFSGAAPAPTGTILDGRTPRFSLKGRPTG